MRVYLPDGVVREMTLTDDQGFLVSYRITNVRQAVDVMNRRGGEEIQQAKGTICETPALDRQVQDHIGQQLQGMYEQLLAEPVPGNLLMLLARLERQDRAQSDDR